jgi:hypothetical protein
MPTVFAPATLTEIALASRLSDDVIRERITRIRHDLLGTSHYVRDLNFTAMHSNDLAFLFRAYDERFFANECERALNGRPLRFRLAPRLTKAGGKTTRILTRAGEESFEIAIAIGMLFDGFGNEDRCVTVCGLVCENRVEAVQRILEHEIIHLVELLCWRRSDCRGARFQDIARRLFLHEAHTHELITRRERAAARGIRGGTRVTFTFEGRRLTGVINRVTKRATVLVEDAQGVPYSDGRRYRTYYVPLAHLATADGEVH